MHEETFIIQENPRIFAVCQIEKEPRVGYAEEHPREEFLRFSFYGLPDGLRSFSLDELSSIPAYPLSEYVGDELAAGRQEQWEKWMAECVSKFKSRV